MGLDTLWHRQPTAACLHSRCHLSPHPRPGRPSHILLLAAAAPPTPESSGQSNALGPAGPGGSSPLHAASGPGSPHQSDGLCAGRGGHQVACSPRAGKGFSLQSAAAGQGRLRPLAPSAGSPAGSVRPGHFQVGLSCCRPSVNQGLLRASPGFEPQPFPAPHIWAVPCVQTFPTRWPSRAHCWSPAPPPAARFLPQQDPGLSYFPRPLRSGWVFTYIVY